MYIYICVYVRTYIHIILLPNLELSPCAPGASLSPRRKVRGAPRLVRHLRLPAEAATPLDVSDL